MKNCDRSWAHLEPGDMLLYKANADDCSRCFLVLNVKLQEDFVEIDVVSLWLWDRVDRITTTNWKISAPFYMSSGYTIIKAQGVI